MRGVERHKWPNNRTSRMGLQKANVQTQSAAVKPPMRAAPSIHGLEPLQSDLLRPVL